MHAMITFSPVLENAGGPGSYFPPGCPSTSFFLVSGQWPAPPSRSSHSLHAGLLECAFVLLNIAWMIIFFDGMDRAQWLWTSFVVCSHLLASFLVCSCPPDRSRHRSQPASLLWTDAPQREWRLVYQHSGAHLHDPPRRGRRCRLHCSICPAVCARHHRHVSGRCPPSATPRTLSTGPGRRRIIQILIAPPWRIGLSLWYPYSALLDSRARALISWRLSTPPTLVHTWPSTASSRAT
jgi:hypothetical protein